MLTDVTTKYDLYREAQQALAEGHPELAEQALVRARRMAKATNHDQPSEDQAQAAWYLARLYRQFASRADCYAMFDEAFGMLAVVLGEAHPRTLECQREYSILLTADALLAQRRQAAMN
jgi:hypothetical protein